MNQKNYLTASYQAMFTQCEKNNRIAFIPFVTLGDPSFEQSLEIIDTLVVAGADALELGIAFSDPVADGPTIQASTIRAIKNGTSPTRAFELLEKIRNRHPNIPIGLLVYANIVYRKSIECFYKKCNELNINSVLIADVPLKEAEDFEAHALKHRVDPVYIVPPGITDEKLRLIAQRSKGYTYLLGRVGVTGTHKTVVMPNQELVQKLSQFGAPPAVLGFGISTPEHVKAARESRVKGVISGSAVVDIIEKYLEDLPLMKNRLESFIRTMVDSTYYADDLINADKALDL